MSQDDQGQVVNAEDQSEAGAGDVLRSLVFANVDPLRARLWNKTVARIADALEGMWVAEADETTAKNPAQILSPLIALSIRRYRVVEAARRELEDETFTWLHEAALRNPGSRARELHAIFDRVEKSISVSGVSGSAQLRSLGQLSLGIEADLGREWLADAQRRLVMEQELLIDLIRGLLCSLQQKSLKDDEIEIESSSKILRHNLVHAEELFVESMAGFQRWSARLSAAEGLAALIDYTDSLGETTRKTLLRRVEDREEHPWVRAAAIAAIAAGDQKHARSLSEQILFSEPPHGASEAHHSILQGQLLKFWATVSQGPNESRRRVARSLFADLSSHRDCLGEFARMIAVEKLIELLPLAEVSVGHPFEWLLVSLERFLGISTHHSKVEEHPRVIAHGVRTIGRLNRQHFVDLQGNEDSFKNTHSVPRGLKYALALVLNIGHRDTRPLVLRSVYRATESLLAAFQNYELSSESRTGFWADFEQALSDCRGMLQAHLRQSELTPQLHEQAAALLEQLRVDTGVYELRLKSNLEAIVGEIAPGEFKRVGWAELFSDKKVDLDRLGRTMAVLSRGDLALQAELQSNGNGLLLYRGERFVTRVWRVLRELRNFQPHKRQGYRHTIGRVLVGQIRAPSGQMHEVTATVPGEPLMSEREGGWARHLPRVDDLLHLPFWSNSDRAPDSSEVKIFSSYGITVIQPPRGKWKHLKARWQIMANYEKWDRMRRLALEAEDADGRASYVQAIEDKLGIRVAFLPYQQASSATARPVPQHVLGLFASSGDEQRAHRGDLISSPVEKVEKVETAPASQQHSISLLALVCTSLALLDAAPESAPWWYFFSLEEANTQGELGWVAAFIALVFFVVAYLRLRRIEKDRVKVPLVIGGWGTRGKSGTERLKSGLFHGLGYQVFSKTTGCEAMFLHSTPGGPQTEIHAFRPYSKATIWEQRDYLSLAASLECDVFLWECMALRPAYVDILQGRWMQDDLSTITNAYPDHEDLQGPAGLDVANTIGRFIPKKSTLVTSESNFLPLFRQRCKEQDTHMQVVDDDEGECISRDLLDLFPYEEHPQNIALVAKMAEELGIDRDLAVLTMAENVVADLGALKRYDPVRFRGRQMEFINACSANDRASFLSSWRRMKCDDRAEFDNPHGRLVAVVNNRDDRISRSQMFAQIIAQDIAVDRCVLIGTNLSGLQTYIEEAQAEYIDGWKNRILREASPGEFQSAKQLAHDNLRQLLRKVGARAGDWSALRRLLSLFMRGAGRDIEGLSTQGIQTRCEAWLGFSTQRNPAPFLWSELHHGVARDRALVLELQALWEQATVLDSHPEDAIQTIPFEDVLEHFRDELIRTAAASRAHAEVERYFQTQDWMHREELEGRLRDLYLELARAQWVVVSDSGASGDQVLQACAKSVGPGLKATLVGMQNIKGTGFDFVRRWNQIRRVKERILAYRQGDSAARQGILVELQALGDHGVVDAHLILHTLSHPTIDESASEAEQRKIVCREKEGALKTALDALESSIVSRSKVRSMWGSLWYWSFDFLVSILRYRRAKKTIRAFGRRSLSHAQTAQRMQALSGD